MLFGLKRRRQPARTGTGPARHQRLHHEFPLRPIRSRAAQCLRADLHCSLRHFRHILHQLGVLIQQMEHKLCVFGCWEGCKSGNSTLEGRTWFRVRKQCDVLKKSLYCKITIFCCKTPSSCYSMEGFTDKFEFSIKNSAGAVIAELKRKQTTSGVYLGDGVLALVIEPQVDHSLIVAQVAVYGSICHRM